MMTDFTPFQSLAGGALIGLPAVMLMAFHGRIAGMTGIVGGLLPPVARDWIWRIAFLAGAVIAPMALVQVAGMTVAFSSPTPLPWLIAGGLIVGVGVTFGGGCPSGHGVCGIARLSKRSIIATFVFMASTAITVFVVRHVIGGV